MDKLLGEFSGKKILMIGIGNVLKSDDGVGVYISNSIKNRKNISSLTVEVSIENYIGKINALRNDVLILLDCMDFKQYPGFWNIIPVDYLKGYVTNTHNISLDKVSELFNTKAYILGIQPKNIQFGETLSPEVKKTADRIIQWINKFN